MKISDFGKSQNVAKFRLNLVDNINTEVLENHREQDLSSFGSMLIFTTKRFTMDFKVNDDNCDISLILSFHICSTKSFHSASSDFFEEARIRIIFLCEGVPSVVRLVSAHEECIFLI